MISVAEADRLIKEAASRPPEAELVPLLRSPGRVLSQGITADRDQPPFDRVAMDGVALAWKDLNPQTLSTSSFILEGVQQAGHPALYRQESQTGNPTALEVTTGAVLPQGCDSVIPWEDIVRSPEGVRFKFRKPPFQAQNIHRRGSDYSKGAQVLEPGTLLSTGHVHLLATVGYDQVPVIKRARIALASTGDELVEVSQTPLEWQIRRSNTLAVEAEARTWGLDVLHSRHFPDQKQVLAIGLDELLASHDVLVLTGGVSMGSFDLVPGVLKDLGCIEIFHKVAQKPGKPLWFGRGPQGQLVFGLPGNPVSSLFSFRRYVLPALLSWEGRRIRTRLVDVPGLTAPGYSGTSFIPVARTGEGFNIMTVQGSGNFYQLVGSAGFVEVGENYAAPDKVPFYPWGIPGGSR